MTVQGDLLRDELCRIAEAQTQIPPERPEFPVPLRQRVIHYVLAQQKRGKTLGECAKELCQPKTRLHYWLYQDGPHRASQACAPESSPAPLPQPALRPVQLVKTLPPISDVAVERHYTLRSPCGWTLQDLSRAELVELLRSLV